MDAVLANRLRADAAEFRERIGKIDKTLEKLPPTSGRIPYLTRSRENLIHNAELYERHAEDLANDPV